MAIVTVANEPLRRTISFRDRDGVLSFSKREDDKVPVKIDWTDAFNDPADTIAAATYADSGVTRSGTVKTNTTTTDVVTGIGETEITVTLTSGQILQRLVRFYDEESSRPSDYR